MGIGHSFDVPPYSVVSGSIPISSIVKGGFLEPAALCVQIIERSFYLSFYNKMCQDIKSTALLNFPNPHYCYSFYKFTGMLPI